jgi:N-acetylneuraminic acid mutarotase
MKNRPIYAWLMAFTVLGFTGCSKSDDSATTLGNWAKRSDFDGYARSDAASFVINGKAYLGTGYDGRNRLKDFWEYDPEMNAWIQKADFGGAARSAAVGFAAAGNGYFTTGYDGINYYNDCWKYDPTANTWTRVADFGGTARYGAVAFGINNKGYVTTGYDGRYLKDFWEYDPAADQWTSKVSIGGSKRMFASAFVINNIGYLVGGVDNNTLVSDFWAYDPSKDSWTQKHDIVVNSDDDVSFDDDYTTITRDHAAAFTIGDTAYLATGENPSLISNVWQYDPKNDLWTERTAFGPGSARIGAVGFSLGNRGFIATGGAVDRGSPVYDDLWEFQPYVENTNN